MAGLQAFEKAMSSVGLSLNTTKTKFWGLGIRPEENDPEFERHRVQSLMAMGTAVPYARASANPRGS